MKPLPAGQKTGSVAYILVGAVFVLMALFAAGVAVAAFRAGHPALGVVGAGILAAAGLRAWPDVKPFAGTGQLPAEPDDSA